MAFQTRPISKVTTITLNPSDKTLTITMREMLNRVHTWFKQNEYLTKARIEGILAGLREFPMNTAAQEKIGTIALQCNQIKEPTDAPSSSSKRTMTQAFEDLAGAKLSYRQYDFCRHARHLLEFAQLDLNGKRVEEDKDLIWGRTTLILVMLQEEHLPENIQEAAQEFATLLTRFLYPTQDYYVSTKDLNASLDALKGLVSESNTGWATRKFGDYWYWRS